jgi:hypothetical protein
MRLNEFWGLSINSSYRKTKILYLITYLKGKEENGMSIVSVSLQATADVWQFNVQNGQCVNELSVSCMVNILKTTIWFLAQKELFSSSATARLDPGTTQNLIQWILVALSSMVFKHGGTSPYLHISFPFHYLKNKYIYLHSVLLALKMTSESISSMVKVKLSLCLPKHHAMKT